VGVGIRGQYVNPLPGVKPPPLHGLTVCFHLDWPGQLKDAVYLASVGGVRVQREQGTLLSHQYPGQSEPCLALNNPSPIDRVCCLASSQPSFSKPKSPHL
jgi:hypothetical protein